MAFANRLPRLEQQMARKSTRGGGVKSARSGGYTPTMGSRTMGRPKRSGTRKSSR